MKLVKARVQNYRSVRDTGEFEVEDGKTILVGPNEAGKSAVLQALQKISRPDEVKPFDQLRDYPRALLNDITTGKVKPTNVPVATGWFALDKDDLAELPASLQSSEITFRFTRYLDDTFVNQLEGAPDEPSYGELEADLARLVRHLDAQVSEEEVKPSVSLSQVTDGWQKHAIVAGDKAQAMSKWLRDMLAVVNEDDERENARLAKIRDRVSISIDRDAAVAILRKRLPVFVLFSNYFRVRPLIHLGHLAQRIASQAFDDDQYDYGNVCLLKLLGLDAAKLSEMGKTGVDARGQQSAQLDSIRDELDARQYQLNAASIRLTKEIRSAWKPKVDRGEADTLRITSDGQYLKVVVVDDLGVEVELDQRSEGFQWLVSFFVVFFAEAEDKHENAVLLLDEPGLHLHGLKQRDFRDTLSRLAEGNQTLYTTHSPFLVGPDELDRVRVVEMTDREVGTKVHTSVTSNDPAALLPLQEALGYDLAQSLFSQQRNFIVEGLTDYWYVGAISELFEEAGQDGLRKNIAVIPAGTAGKVVYFATILHAHSLKVAALLDSDSAGDSAAQQETLVHSIGHKGILRTADVLDGTVTNPEIEDLLRTTLTSVAKDELGHELPAVAGHASRSMASILKAEKLSKYQLAKAFVRWCRNHSLDDLLEEERAAWATLFAKVNGALK
ncbi:MULTISPECIES: AAA family ATPase [unclassified Paracoccus (in: a-proteobacteria)]|uniref:AAA family ATPase n=1 Tax=unclassified Paracoccus (in: a-proteobacteria) TaxID=2688777 RepID=UPI001F220B95|nr:MULTISPECIES: AAA family ATPase [unclassified Paracoccus (in: a-proteobacteria)]QXO85690.1 AAA family ATPase [Paracoccus sp. (in: a-proteobacteria)]